ncbi:glycosyltransferase [Akkermansiaceae bacterium]|nr:glycosyltransferase [bacterium]MDA8975705.1 glycosyltransferase [Akkermansiaceae bacterium]MDB4321263.1 glycosyltransferase [Akkermansiaceae bacterium]MDB4411861.1 glycosyltransferase [Akkermansiaceae bacterium]MDB4670079.1 glycosyltransferase [Akkermansiaceae bacterium]
MVAHILSYFPGQEGLTSFCRGLGSAFEKIEGVEVPIISFRGTPARESSGSEPPLIKFPYRNRHPFDLPPAFLAALDSGELELKGAILHGTYSPQVFALARALHRRKIPYIFMPHDPYVSKLQRHKAFRKFIYWHLCEKWVIQHAAAVQLLSSAHELSLRERGMKVPVFTIANGCDPSDLVHMAPDSRIPGGQSDFRIQYLGRMDRNHKGLDLLIRGYAQFLDFIDKDEKIQLVLSGNDWEDRDFLENLARSLNLGDRISFTGRLSAHSIAIHSQADLCVLTSRFDGFGLTLVEAMMAFRPVLVSKEAGIADHVLKAGGGFVVDADPNSIADGLLEAWNNRADLSKIGEAGHRYVTQELTWESIANQSVQIYRKYFGG